MKGKLLLFYFAVLLVISPALSWRWQEEMQTNTVSMLFDSHTLEQLAQESEESLSQWLEELQAAGLCGLALHEESLETLKERSVLTWLTRAQALASPYWTSAYPEAVQTWLMEQEDGILVALWDAETEEWLSNALSGREISFQLVQADEMRYLLLDGDSDLTELPLGFWPETVGLAQSLGLECCAVLSLPEDGNTLALAGCLYREWKAAGVNTVLCIGGSLPGWEESESGATQLLQDFTESGATLALVESSTQQGSLDFPGKEAVLQQSGALVRCFYQWDYISNRYGALGYSGDQEVSMALARSAAERNCRILWLTAMTDSESDEEIEALSDYTHLLEQLETDLNRFGLEVGPVHPVTASSALPVLAAQLLSWVTASGTGCLCAWLLLRHSGEWGRMALCLATALLGGLAASVWLSGSAFFLGEESFRGVKPAQLVPLTFFLLLWCRRLWRRRREALCRWWAAPVTGGVLLQAVGACLCLLLLAGVGIYYLLRTGNSTLASDLELRIRNALEVCFTVRPRFKEFALGVPCLVLWCRVRLPGWAEPLIGLGAMIGLVSITNTFLHVCTPLRISLIRTGAGWLLGGLLALLLLGLIRLGRWALCRVS